MLTEFVSLQLSREELVELHEALIQRAMVEDELRRERGQESADQFPLLERIEMLLGDKETALIARDARLEDELWEYAWYAFTDEWACFRADQDTLKQVGADASEQDKKKCSERLYRQKFNSYVEEVGMWEGEKKNSARKAQEKNA
jgi:hypothetical protein